MSFNILLNNYNSEDEQHNKFLEEIKSRYKNFRLALNQVGRYNCSCSRKNMTNEQINNFKSDKYHIIWSTLHDLSFLYLHSPDQGLINIMQNLLKDELSTISCPICRQHYLSYIKNVNFNEICNCKLNLIIWLIDLHNDINKKYKKPILSYEDIFNKYNLDYKITILNWV